MDVTRFQRVLHSVMCNRVLFRIFQGRKSLRKDSGIRYEEEEKTPVSVSDRGDQTNVNVFTSVFLERSDYDHDWDSPMVSSYAQSNGGVTQGRQTQSFQLESLRKDDRQWQEV